MEKRLFIACPVQGQAVEAELTADWEKVVPMLPTWVAFKREPSLHITLRFLGAVNLADPERKTALGRLVQDLTELSAETPAIPLVVGPLGVFQGVVWASVVGSNEAMEGFNRLQNRVDGAVNLRGWPDADYPFMPHITIGRFPRDATADVTDFLRVAREADPETLDFKLGCVELMESIRGENGVEYVQAAPPFTLSGKDGAGEVRR